MLACTDLSKTYGDRRVLKGCTLEIAPGKCVVLRGRSGAGKTTLLKCLALLENSDSGRIVHDESTFDFPGAAPTRKQVASVFPFLTIVFQQLHLWPNLTVRENITLVTAHDRKAALPAEAGDLLGRLSIADLVDLRPGQCSLGQRQRVAVARALLTPARYILLDEPTSALDRTNRRIVVELLGAARAAGRGFMIISHDEREFASITDQLLELDDGVLTPAEV